MSNDDSRGNESPDRRDEPTPSSTIRTHLETLDTLTHALLEALHDPHLEIDGQPPTESDRREARRRCREIRAETSQLGLRLFGPDAVIPYRPEGSSDADAQGGVTVYSGPESDRLERDRDDESDATELESADSTDGSEPDPRTHDDGSDESRATDDRPDDSEGTDD
ncbi:hypothetical protein [Salinadaptatus halalkaliphilus]|uniref:hypothetical protein n=1 Tax=Salinadaptatus halalkaliphilus TaxID=2419781 RepID=UPI001FEC78AF|nr:hypothetical protein [Salinadaptatus halalkaliphilus]